MQNEKDARDRKLLRASEDSLTPEQSHIRTISHENNHESSISVVTIDHDP